MFNQIMVPVDLEHLGGLAKSLAVAADLSNKYDAPVCYVGVSSGQPDPISKSPGGYSKKLADFAAGQEAKHGHKVSSQMFASHDLVTDVDDVLLKAVEEVGADLVVMASHIPTIVDYVWPSNGGKIAAHSNASVFVVR